METVVAAVVAAIAALAGVFIGGRNQAYLNLQLFQEQRQREDLLHARQLAAQQHDRVKAKYERVLLACRKLNGVFYREWMLAALSRSEQQPMHILDTEEADEYGIAMALIEVEVRNDDIVELGRQYTALLLKSDPAVNPPEQYAVVPSDIAQAYFNLKSAIIEHLRTLEALVEK